MKQPVLRLTHPELWLLKKILDERVRDRLFFGTRRQDPLEYSLNLQVTDLIESLKEVTDVPVS